MMRKGRSFVGGRWDMARPRSRSSAGSEQFAEQPLGLAQPLLGEHDRLGLADRVGDEALLVQPVHRVPVEALPGPVAVVPAEVEQGEDRLVDPVGADLHDAGLGTRAAWHPPTRS
jgi:hypothetical protein